MTAMTSWQNRKNNGTCKKSACEVCCEGERFAAKPAHLDRVEDPLYEGFCSVSAVCKSLRLFLCTHLVHHDHL